MKITIKNINKTNTEIKYLIEREKGTYNNIVETVIFNQEEIQGLTENEIKTLGFKRIKHVAERVFNEIEPLNEEDNAIDFELVESRPVKVEIQGLNVLEVGQSYEYNAIVFDQYGEVIAREITWANKVLNATEEGTIKVIARVGGISNFLDVEIVPHVPSKEEQQQELVDKLILDNLNMQMQIDTLITTSLEV